MSPCIAAALDEMHREGYSLVRESTTWAFKLGHLNLLRPLLTGQDPTQREILADFVTPHDALVSYGQTLLAQRAS